MSVRECGELDPGDEIEGQGGDVCPGLVRGEVEERYLESLRRRPARV